MIGSATVLKGSNAWRCRIAAAFLASFLFVGVGCSKNGSDPNNHAPKFLSGSQVDVRENNRITNYTAHASDEDGDAVVYSLTGGKDRSLFTVDASSGVLKFIEPPSHGAPKDENQDNLYLVDITAADGRGGSAKVRVAVQVRPAVTQPLSQVSAPAMPFGQASMGAPRNQEPARAQASQVVSKGAPPKRMESYMVAAALDEANNRVLVVDWHHLSLMGVDLATGERRIISGGDRGRGEPFISPKAIDLDHQGARALVVDVGKGALIGVDLASGDRHVISDDERGTGPAFVLPGSVATDPADTRVLVVDWSLQSLFEVDLASGDRTLISGGEAGVGVPFESPYAATLDVAENRAFVIDKGLGAVLAVDLVSGDRTLVSGKQAGHGPPLLQPYAIVFDAEKRRVLIADGGRDAIVAVNVVSGFRKVVTGEQLGSGPALKDPRSIALLRNVPNRLVVVDWSARALFSTDLATGARNIVSDGFSPIKTFEGLEYKAGDSRRVASLAMVAPVKSSSSLSSSELNKSSDEVLVEQSESHKEVDALPSLSAPAALLFDSQQHRMLIIDEAQAELVSVDIESGARQVISSTSVGLGPQMKQPMDVAWFEPGESLVVLDPILKALVVVELSSGDRRIVSGPDVGSGELFKHAHQLTVDAQSKIAYVLDSADAVVWKIDLKTGDRDTAASF